MLKESIKIIAINASPKKNGQTTQLLNLFVENAQKFGAEIVKLNLYQAHIPFYSGKLGAKIKKLSNIQKEMVEADGFVIATPTYWFNEPGVLKNFIDSMTPLEENGFMLEGKVAGFIVYSPEGGETDVVENLAMTFNQMGVLLPPYSLIFYRGPQDKWAKKDIPLLAKNMLQQIRAQRKFKISWDYE